MTNSKKTCIRLIPAHAGSTASQSVSCQMDWAHPRSRGEHSVSVPVTGIAAGLSPLTRGAHRRGVARSGQSRLIPAHAGSTRRRLCSSRTLAAHPRSRGEHEEAILAALDERGSSPLTRGALATHQRRPPSLRLLPAHAGSTVLNGVRPLWAPAHPRSRGEHLLQKLPLIGGGGSSPLTRGALAKETGVPADLRLIPAHAGSTRRP